jgi:hypothetical protein
MRLTLITGVLFSMLLTVGCKTTNTTQPSANSAPASSDINAPSSSPASQPSTPVAPSDTTAAKPKIDACALLTSQEIESVQGEAVKETKLSEQSGGGFTVSQCFFSLPTFTNSVSLLVAQKGDGAGAKDPKLFWRETFHKDEREERERERDKKDRDKKRGEEEEEESSPPLKVAGIGDEAFWMGSRVGGALYVLKGNAYVRISIGGPADQANKIKRSKALAQKAIARL